MNQSVKSIIALVILICLGASVLGWTCGIEGVPDSRFWLRTSGILLLPAIGLLVWADFRRDRVPDFLRKHVKRYFEQDGFCFMILPSVKDGCFAWQILFQNRFERPCNALVAFRPATRFVGFGRADLPDVRIEVDCDGGGFGSANVPYGIPRTYQGKRQQFELIAVSHFPDGKGEMLRFRDGMRVGKHQKSIADTAITALSVIALHPHFTHPATFKIKLPNDVKVDATGEASQKILWRLDDQTAEGKAGT